MTRGVSVHRFRNGAGQRTQDSVAVEEPLEIRIRYKTGARWNTQAVSVTMRTPGHDRELATGFLFAEGLIRDAADIATTDVSGEHANEITFELADGAEFDWERLRRNFYTTSSCGVCGKASLQALEVEDGDALIPAFTVTPQTLESLPRLLRESQTLFAATGGLHAAGLFDASGRLLALFEDVGRHNACDKLIGHMLFTSPGRLSESILMLSGRASFELLQKAWRARIGLVAAVGAPSSLAVDLACRFGITLAGFLRENRFNVYTHSERIQL